MTDTSTTPVLDHDGYLVNLADWNQRVAELLSNDEGITLTPAHWELIWLIRQFYDNYQLSPSQRPLVKYVKEHLGDEKGNSLYLLQMFPGSPAKLLARIAGLPRPTNCF